MTSQRSTKSTEASIYVSYSHSDSGVVRGIVNELARLGVPVWMNITDLTDITDLDVGARWQQKRKDVRDHSDMWLVFLGARLSLYQKEELEAATHSTDRRLVPVLLPGVSGRDVPEFLVQFHGIQLNSQQDPTEQALEIAEFIRFEPNLDRRTTKARRKAGESPSSDLALEEGEELAETPPQAPAAREVPTWATADELPTLLARLALHDAHALKLLADPDAGTLRGLLRKLNVATERDAAELAASVTSAHSAFKPHPLWAAWLRTVHEKKLKDLETEFAGLPTRSSSASTQPTPPPSTGEKDSPSDDGPAPPRPSRPIKTIIKTGRLK